MIEYKLNIGDLRVSKNEAATFTCLGLGSCLGFFLQDRALGLSGGAHILLPNNSTSSAEPGKFYAVVEAVSEMIKQFRAAGSSCANLRAKVTGGASVIKSGSEIGKRNAQRMIEELTLQRVFIAAMDVGGANSRTARFNCEDGALTVRFPGTNEFKIY